MIELKNVLISIDEIFIMPIAIITFFFLIYVLYYLNKKDPDVIRAKIFLGFSSFKKAFILIAAFAFVLILHISLIYIPHYLDNNFGLPLPQIQHFLGLVLVLVLIAFVYYIYRSIK
jgi:hypothetical protein